MLDLFNRCSNIHLFPYISHAMIPRILEQFDLLLLPFQLTPFSHYINPLKLSEYLSSGKPIVSTPLSEVVRIASFPEKTVYFIENPEDLGRIVERALSEDTPLQKARRIDLARSRTWEKTTARLASVVNELLEGKITGQPREDGFVIR